MDEPIHIVTVRTVRLGCEAVFEMALHNFVQHSLVLPGQLGVHIICPPRGGGSREYGIIRRFANRAALAAFRKSPEYRQWNQFALGFTEGDSRAEELHGLESWFTMPGQPLRAIPQWKMAIATYIGVDVATTVLFWIIGPAIQNWPFLIRNSAFNVLVVAALTWLIMPLLTRVLNKWLQPKQTEIFLNNQAPTI